MNQEDIYNICENEHELLAFLQTTKLLLNEKVCVRCNKDCYIIKINNKFNFACRKCRNQYGCAPKGYFLYNVKIRYDICLKIMYLFLVNVTCKQCSEILGVSEQKLVDWYNFCREVCFVDLKSKSKKIGGKGKHVEIDESVFGKRKYNKGRFKDGQWVVGGIERESGVCFFETVEKRDNKTLLEVILRNVEKETTIITDEWKGYKDLEQQTYKHLKVNHSKGFVNPYTNQHTNTIESTWGKVSKNLKKLKKCCYLI